MGNRSVVKWKTFASHQTHDFSTTTVTVCNVASTKTRTLAIRYMQPSFMRKANQNREYTPSTCYKNLNLLTTRRGSMYEPMIFKQYRINTLQRTFRNIESIRRKGTDPQIQRSDFSSVCAIIPRLASLNLLSSIVNNHQNQELIDSSEKVIAITSQAT